MIFKDKIDFKVRISGEHFKNVPEAVGDFKVGDTVKVTFSYSYFAQLKTDNDFNYELVSLLAQTVLTLYKDKCFNEGFFEKEIFKRLSKYFNNHLKLKLLTLNKTAVLNNNKDYSFNLKSKNFVEDVNTQFYHFEGYTENCKK